jgi:hypothetical protein
MPQYNLGEIMSFSTRRMGRRADIDKSFVSFYVNASYFEVVAQLPDKLQERIAISSTTSGENRITLPSDFGEPINISILTTDHGSGKTLQQISESRYDERGTHPLGEPSSYVLYHNWLELLPSPDSGYSLQLRYRSIVTDMLEESEVPSVHTDARKAIWFLTEAEVAADIGDVDRESAARQRYVNYISTVKNESARRQRGQGRLGVNPVYPEVRVVSKRSFDVV